MTVYAEKATKEQREAMQKYEEISGFECIHQDELDSGELTFEEVWNKNIRWLEDMVADVININIDMAKKGGAE